MARLLRPLKNQNPHVPGVNAAIGYCNDIGDAFEKASRSDANTRKLAGLFTSGISEAIVDYVLEHSPRQPNCTIKDTAVLVAGSPLNSCNIDFFYAPDPADEAEAYECKNSPTGIFSEFMGLHAHPDPSKQLAWERSKLYLLKMLKVHLDAIGIPTHLGLISLHPRSIVHKKLRRMADQMGAAIPGILAVYGRDDIFDHIRPGIPRPVFATAP